MFSLNAIIAFLKGKATNAVHVAIADLDKAVTKLNAAEAVHRSKADNHEQTADSLRDRAEEHDLLADVEHELADKAARVRSKLAELLS